MHLYAFGSVCRGEIDRGSDIDLLAIIDRDAPELDPSKFAIYSPSRIEELWCEGNPFAWHLATESKLLFSSVGDDLLMDLGNPSSYAQAARDCRRFQRLFFASRMALLEGTSSPVFELSTAFLAIRNFATCYALGCKSVCEFSRFSPRRLGDKSLAISDDAFAVLEKSRLLSTRAYGEIVVKEDVALVLHETEAISNWMDELLKEV